MRQFDNWRNTYLYLEHMTEDDPEYESRMLLSHMLKHLDNYLNTCVIQLHRISEDTFNIEKASEQSHNNFQYHLTFTQLWSDCYFYLNVVERSYRLIEKIYLHLNMPQRAKELWNSSIFKEMKSVRNIIQHMDENLEDGLEKSKPYLKRFEYHNINWFDSQYGQMDGNMVIRLKEHEFGFNESSMEALYSYYDEISKIINERYVKPNKENVDAFWGPVSDRFKE